MPWTAITNLAQARAWIAEVGRDNAGILVDALHFHRGGSRLEDLRSVPDKQLNVFQICDAPLQFGSNHDDLRRVSRGERLLPGKGELDLLTLVERIPAHAIISVEVPSARDALRFSAQERAIRALRTTKEILEKPF